MKNSTPHDAFELIRKTEISELDATLYEYRHRGCGTELVYIDRDDENKTFAIAFPTPPVNDTGVFHIIEHSVLCGSEKYPLKDPFAELLKSSLNTFLNAMTYEDRTVYPVSSRCERDFMNLVDVYMDAVLRPNMLKNPSIFAQEGWHYEYDTESDSLSYNGVVYNEMKGAYSSPDELGAMALSAALFSDSVYCRDSGGNPDRIPELSFEELKATHEKHYHPSGAKIILDGRMDISSLLSLIDSHLSRYERSSAIKLDSVSSPKVVSPVEVKFEISEKEEAKGRGRILFGYVYSDFEDSLAQMSASIFADLLCGSNASPLKKALIDEGLCKDVMMYMNRSRHQTVILEIRDTDADKLDRITEVINRVISELVKDGIDRERLGAIINSLEFRLLERDFGSLPSGIAYALSAFGHWMYGGMPENALITEETVKKLRLALDSDYFEVALSEMTIDNPHRATVVMIPDPTLAARSKEERAKRLSEIRETMSDEDIQKIIDAEKALREWQESEESEAALASIPSLTLEDVPAKRKVATVEEKSLLGVKMLHPQVKMNGIVYIYLYFDARDMAKEELLELSLLASAMLNFPTASMDTLSLQSDIKANLGSFFISSEIAQRGGDAIPYLKVGMSALASKTDDLLRILREVLFTSRIDNEAEIASILAQAKSQIEDIMIASGESVALARLEASISEVGAMNEYLSGYEAYRIICDILKDEERLTKLTNTLNKLPERIFTRNRLTASVSGRVDGGFEESLIGIFPERDENIEKKSTPLCAEHSEFFLIPSKVAYAVIGGKTDRVRDNLGYMRVARTILSYEYLWNTVRVKSGAYGTGFVPRRDGSISFYSYRDPSPARSIGFYKASADYLRALAEESPDLSKFIIGAIGEYDIITTPRTAAMLTTRNHMSGWSAEDEARVREQMLSMKPSDLLTVADIIDEALTDYGTAVVGGSEHLDSLPEKPARVIEI